MGAAMTGAEVKAVARRVVELLDGPSPLPHLLTAAEVADRLAVTEQWVRENADRLGGVKLSDGPRPRLRFDPTVVAESLSLRSPRNVSSAAGSGSGAGRAPRRPARGPAVIGQKVPLLPAAVSRSRVKAEPSPEKRSGRRRANDPPAASRNSPSTQAQRSPSRASRASDGGPPRKRRKAR
jgi:hypothetical protein